MKSTATNKEDNIKVTDLTPEFATHPGEFLNDELVDRGINQTDFAKTIGVKKSQLNEVIKGKRAINTDLALLLEMALEIDASFWLNAQTNYELDCARIATRSKDRLIAIEQWKMISPYVPIPYFKKEKALTMDPVKDIPLIKKIYGVPHLEDIASATIRNGVYRFKKSETLEHEPVNLTGWVKYVQFLAKDQQSGVFDYKKKDSLIAELRKAILKNCNLIESVQELLFYHGIKLIIKEKGSKTPVDGIAFWSNDNPAIGMTLRHKGIDRFAFTLFHELGHIFLHVSNDRQKEFIDIDQAEEEEEYKESQEELEANEFAANALIDEVSWKKFYNPKTPYNDKDVIAFAKIAGIHPAIVKGRFCHEKRKFNVFSKIDCNIK